VIARSLRNSLREANAPERQYRPEYSQSNPEISQNVVPKVPNYDLAPLEADAILTFNQTVEHVQAQGGRDLSRYPAVTELYDKASGIRPKLALSMDDTGRKEQMLSDMHDKLSQAVKLYDQILTQQVAQPRRQTAATSPTLYQQQQSFGTGYSQWAPQATLFDNPEFTIPLPSTETPFKLYNPTPVPSHNRGSKRRKENEPPFRDILPSLNHSEPPSKKRKKTQDKLDAIFLALA